MSAWTRERVDSLAPDSQSIKAGSGLARESKWPLLGTNGRAAWGECKGSGKKPYQARVDLEALAYKCSCPSRKFPCKHALGLLYLLADKGDTFPTAEPPEWVAEWITGRTEREQKKVERAKAKAEKPVDEKAQAKRLSKREDKVSKGIADLQLWMQDIVRNGLIETQRQPYSFWDTAARRLIDAQAPGLARRLQALSGTAVGGQAADPYWAHRVMSGLGEIYLLTEGWGNRDHLPSPLLQSLRSEIGFQTASEEVLKEPRISDRWLVNAHSIEQIENNIQAQRVWLRGQESNRDALILNFAHRSAPFDFSAAEGSCIEADLAFYPSAFPLRALVAEKKDHSLPPPTTVFSYSTLAQTLGAYSEALISDPFIDRFPISIESASIVHHQDTWYLLDPEDSAIPMRLDPSLVWPMIAVTGGRPMRVFGEWNGEVFRPLTAIQDDEWHRIG